MNLFRSKEHVKRWSGYREGTEEGILDLAEIARLFSGELFTRRLDADYLSRFPEYLEKFAGAVSELGKTRTFWRMAA